MLAPHYAKIFLKVDMIKIFVLLFFAASIVSNAEANGLTIYNGYLTGNSYLALSQKEKTGYAMGIVDGLVASSMVTGSDTNLNRLSDCLHQMTNIQVAALFKKYLRENPKYLHGGMNFMAISVIKENCGIPSAPPGQSE